METFVGRAEPQPLRLQVVHSALATVMYLETKSINDCTELSDLLMVTEVRGKPIGRPTMRVCVAAQE